MAIFTIKTTADFGQQRIMAPERYDPRLAALSCGDGAVRLREIVATVRETIGAANGDRPCLVLDTSDAREGIIRTKKESILAKTLGSVKRVARPGDVIVSRLRPYLRQVGLIDAEACPDADVVLACSTEFFVLRGVDERSIAFLVPYLLSSPVQTVLAAAQEGGHHPRVPERTVLELPLAMKLLRERDAISAQVIDRIGQYREVTRSLSGLVEFTERCLDQHKE